ncbi:DUF3619 family protein [Parazoarcus communis]|jgi:hypothetical protein|uniref:DUF3619 family protein n=1 Tax=Parazoarcus communis TaxID=41977 RepID=UPI001F1AB502|nr:DUF3619 family protein [Parazoarcus communis]
MTDQHQRPRGDTLGDAAVARRIVGSLSVAAHHTDERVAERLRAARLRALEAHRPRRGMAARFLATMRAAWSLRPVLRQSVAMAAVVVLVFAGDHWTTSSLLLELEEVDAALLTDELPIDAYLDSDFPTWLQQDSSS